MLFRSVISLYALIDSVLSLCMIMVVIALLVGRSQSLASLHPVLRMSSTRASNSQKTKVCQMCPPYLPICDISPPLQVNSLCASFEPLKLLNLFFVPVLAHEELLSTLLSSHVWWFHTLTTMHNVLVPNIAKGADKRVPSPLKYKINK